MTSFFSKPFWLGIAGGVIAILLVGGTLWALQRTEQPAQPQKLAITYQNGLLSVDLKDTELKGVLEEIARQTGIKVRVSPEVKQKVSAKFTGLKLREALEKLLSSSNYALIFRRRLVHEPEMPSEIHILLQKAEGISSQPTNDIGLENVYKSKGAEEGLENFTFNYPKGWVISNSSTRDQIFIKDSSNVDIRVVGVSIFNNEEHLSFEEWLGSQISSNERLQFAIESQAFSINGFPAYAFYLPDYTPSGGLGGYTQLDIYLYHEGYVYNIGYTPAPSVRFPLSPDDLALRILSSLRFE